MLTGFSNLSLIHFAGEFYGNGLSAANLDLIAAFYEKHPGYVDKTFLSVKGGFKAGTFHHDAS
jgi:pyridoxine 4-dehydrogenase